MASPNYVNRTLLSIRWNRAHAALPGIVALHRQFMSWYLTVVV